MSLSKEDFSLTIIHASLAFRSVSASFSVIGVYVVSSCGSGGVAESEYELGSRCFNLSYGSSQPSSLTDLGCLRHILSRSAFRFQSRGRFPESVSDDWIATFDRLRLCAPPRLHKDSKNGWEKFQSGSHVHVKRSYNASCEPSRVRGDV